MASNQIYQIYYNQETLAQNDDGFLHLDNLSNLRPDWSEYWPIRKYLISNDLQDDCYYGFFSPKFYSKTKLTSIHVKQLLNNAQTDVVTFSPYFDQSAFALNVFEQAIANHPNIEETFKEAFNEIIPNININNMVMSSESTIFCNYFAAKKNFWIKWFEICEKIFMIAEQKNSRAAEELNKNVAHSGLDYPAKVFVIERIASLLIAKEKTWTVTNYDPVSLPFSTSKVSGYRNELVILDSLKIAYLKSNNFRYLEQFFLTRDSIINSINANK